MPALTYERVLSVAVTGVKHPAKEIRDCLDALRVARPEVGAGLGEITRHLVDDYSEATTGALVLAVLKANTVAAVGAWVAIIAPKAKVNAAEIIADAYLALDAWVIDWNRRQIRRVA